MQQRWRLGAVTVWLGCACVGGGGADAGGIADAPGRDAPGLDAPGLDAPGLDAPGLDAPGLDAPGLDAPLQDTGPRPDGGEVAPLSAEIHASREVARIPAVDAPASDSESVLTATVSAGVTSWRWEVRESETDVLAAEGTGPTYTFTCPAVRAAYDVVLIVGDGTSEARYRERRLVTCTLPRTDAGRRVLRADLAVASYFQNGLIGATTAIPGDVIRVRGTVTANWTFFNFQGTAEAPIHIINEGPVVNHGNNRALHLVNCRHVIVDGFGDDAVPYGIVLDGTSATGSQALYVRSYTEGTNVEAGSTDIEIFGVHVAATPGTGIQVDTHGTAAFHRDNWRFDDLRVHHNFVENTENEGLYLGYTRDYLSTTGGETDLAFQIYDARVYRNRIRDTGNDGLQICNFIERAEVHDNHVSGAATRNNSGHTSALQINSGTSGWIYDNVFLGGTGVNVQSGCTGGSLWLYSNVIDRETRPTPPTSGAAIYLLAGAATGTSFFIFDNTIRTRDAHAINLNLDSVPTACGAPVALDSVVAVNNVVLLPDAPVGTRAAVVFRFDSPMVIAPTIVTTPNVTRAESAISELCFAGAATSDYRIACATSPALAGDAMSLSSRTELAPSALAGGFFTDRSSRVFADPRNYGAHQLLAP